MNISILSNGLIDKRYANKDAAGRVKQSKLTGREDIMALDWELFVNNPVLGVGVGVSGKARDETKLQGVQSHSEPTRLLAEHGSLGLIILIMLVFVPIFNYYGTRNYENLYFLPFLIFWALTINHAATRIVAPSVLYAICLLQVKFKEET